MLNKKVLLSALIAMGCFGFVACGGDDDDDCTNNEKRCDGLKYQTCYNGEWKDVKTCETACNASGCVTQDCTGDNCGKPPVSGTDCPTEKGAACDKSCTPVCSADKGHAYLCGSSGTVMEWTCANNVCSVSGSDVTCPKTDNPATGEYVKTGEKCEDSYKKHCETVDGKSVVYTCYKGEEEYMPCADCTVDDKNYYKCGGGSGTTTTGDPCPTTKDAPCDKNCQPVCSADNGHAYLCGSKSGTVMEWTCADNVCSVSGSTVNCPKEGGSTGSDNTLPNPENMDRTPGGSCSKDTYYGACSDDWSKRYYCDDSGKIVEKDCSTDCDPASLGNNSSKCKSGGSTPVTSDIPSEIAAIECVQGTTPGKCGSDKKAYVCGDKGWYANSKCEGECFECGDGYWVACGTSIEVACKDHMEPQKECSDDARISEGGNVGDCCDNTKYVPDCTNMLRCDSKGYVAAINCNDGKVCTLSTDGTCKACNQGKAGSYDTAKYPTGYFECISDN